MLVTAQPDTKIHIAPSCSAQRSAADGVELTFLIAIMILPTISNRFLVRLKA